MPRLNYRHLEYFWHVAREGGVTAAAEVLHVSQPSISAQIRKLEKAIGHELFRREGRSMTLTHEGKIVFDYADEIFRMGDELQKTVQGGLAGRPMRLVVGVAATVPNVVAFHLLGPAFELEDPVRIVVRESRTDRLLTDLASHEIDLILSDRAVPPDSMVRAFSHSLGSSPVDILGPPLLSHRVRDGFPGSLDGEPFILPAEGYALRRSLEEWFEAVGIRPRIFAEIEDTDLVTAFAEAGAGMLAVPSVITPEIRVHHALEIIGRAAGVREDFYAITADRRLEHPAVVAITEGARRDLFTEEGTE